MVVQAEDVDERSPCAHTCTMNRPKSAAIQDRSHRCSRKEKKKSPTYAYALTAKRLLYREGQKIPNRTKRVRTINRSLHAEQIPYASHHHSANRSKVHLRCSLTPIPTPTGYCDWLGQGPGPGQELEIPAAFCNTKYM